MAGSGSSVVAARLELAATAAMPGGSIDYAVINTGALPVMLGEACLVERRTGDGWEALPFPRFSALWGRRLEAGDRHELSARVWEFAQPGCYRLRKRLDVDRIPYPGYEWVAGEEIEPIELTAEFNVAPD